MSRTTFSADMSWARAQIFSCAGVVSAISCLEAGLIAPPGLAADRLEILRHAYDQALKEPDLVEESKKRNWELDHIRGEKLAALANSVMDSSPQLVERLKELLAR